MERRTLILAMIMLPPALLLAVYSLLLREQYMPISVLLLGAAMLPFFLRFELRRLQAREVVLVALLAAIAAVSRVPFAALPSVQPTTFVILMAGFVFGVETGFMVGALAALASNMFLGHGPWTPWQMFSWGMAGAAAGLLRRTFWMQTRWGLLSFGLLVGLVFGWLMNLSGSLALLGEWNWKAIGLLYTSSFYFDLAHGLSNMFFIAVFAPVWLKVLRRFKSKYGLLEDER